MIFYIGFIINIIGLFYVTYKTIKTNNIISPQIIVFFGLFVYLYLPAIVMSSQYIEDNIYNLLLIIGLIGAFFACDRFPYDIVKDGIGVELRIPKIIFFQIGTYIYLFLLLFQIIQAIISAGGIFAVFRVNRLDAYLNGEIISESLIIEFFKEGLKIFFYFYFAYLVEKKKIFKALLLFAVPMIHHRFTAVTRFDFIAMAASLAVYFIDRRLIGERDQISIIGEKKRNRIRKHKVSFLRLLLLGIVGLYLSLLFMRIANFTRFGERANGINLSFGSILKSTILNDSLYYEYLHTLYEAVGQGRIRLEYGLSWFIYPIINFIPRAIWNSKPYTAFSARITDKVYWNLTSGNPVVTFSILGEGYVQFGVIGIFVCSYIFLKSRWINFNLLKKIKYNEMYMLILLFSLVTYMRSEAPVFYALIDTCWLYVIQLTCTYTKREIS